jgi:hypothetical protein
MRHTKTPRYYKHKGPPHVSPDYWEKFWDAFTKTCAEKDLRGQRNWRERLAFKEDMLREWGILSYWEPSTWQKKLLARAKVGARKRGIEFSLQESDLDTPLICPILGCELNYPSLTSQHCRPETPSVDRIDNTLGYVPGNVQVISWRANRLKNDATLQELYRLGQWAARGLATNAPLPSDLSH